MALGLPVITNDDPPMNEVIRDGDNGLLVASRRRGRAQLGDPGLQAERPRAHRGDRARSPTRAARASCAPASPRARERLAWEHTVADYAELVGRFG